MNAARHYKNGESEGYKEKHESSVRDLFSLFADTCGESDVIVDVDMEKLPGTCSKSMLLLVQEPI
jgi:hypothetical protein